MKISEAGTILGEGFGFTAEDAYRVVQSLDLAKDATVLDIGTGVGNMAITLALNGYRVLTGEPKEDDSVYAKQDWLGNAKKVGVDHLITFRAFNAKAMPFEDDAFAAIFSLGALHHVDEGFRIGVLKECVRTTRSGGLICIFEPNLETTKMIRKMDPAHPEPADPRKHIKGLNLETQKIKGTRFDAFIFKLL